MRAAYGGDVEEAETDPNRWQMLQDVATETEVMDELLLQTAVADGMTVFDEEARVLLDRTREVTGDGFGKMLEERGANEEAFRDFLVERELINRYKEKLFAGVAINESALQEYYKGHAETFTETDQVRLEILTFVVGETAEKMNERWTGVESFDSIEHANFY